MIFIVPSDFLKLISASKILNIMINNGTFTHIYHPNNEKMFENANIDIIVFRYYKNNVIEKISLYNEKKQYILIYMLVLLVEKKKYIKIMN
jgi:adenine-specific DNA-methyltransferase